MGIVILLIVWEAAGRFSNVPEYILPMPSSITRALINNYDLLIIHGKYTLMAALLGLFTAILFSALISFAMNKWAGIKKAFYPLMVISQTIPIIALAPVIMIWFGLGFFPKILTVALVCFFPLTVNITEGLGETPREEKELMEVMGAGPLEIFKHLQLPSTLPYFFTGLKISATYSVMGAVIGEWLGGNKGIGVYMIRSMHTYNVSNLFAGIIVVILLSIMLFKFVELISRIFMPWDRKEEKKR